MSEKHTRIRVKRTDATGYWGYLDFGELTREEMVKTIRARADWLRKEVADIDATRDEDFEVDVVRGRYVQKHIRSVP